MQHDYVLLYKLYQSSYRSIFFFFNDTATTEIYTLSLHDALPISRRGRRRAGRGVERERLRGAGGIRAGGRPAAVRGAGRRPPAAGAVRGAPALKGAAHGERRVCEIGRAHV